MPDSRRGGDLLRDLLDRMQKIETAVASLHALVVERVASVSAQAEQQARLAEKWFGQDWPAHAIEHKEINERLHSLETTRSRAEGAAWIGRLIWGVLAAVAGAGATALMRGHS